MATKTWVGGDSSGDGDISLADNWQPLTIRSSSWQWTASGSGTNEYYLEASGGGDPGIGTPGNVQVDGTNATEGTAGSLAAGEYDWADNDTLGYSTVYLRLSDGTDPDTQELDYVTYTQTPQASDDVVIPASSSEAIDDGLQSLAAISLGEVTIEAGYAYNIGTATEFLRLTCTAFECRGTGQMWIDLQASDIDANIVNSANVGTGSRGLYLIGSDLNTVTVTGGHVGIAWRGGETATVTTLRVSGGSVWVGEGTTMTTVYQTAGDVTNRAAATTVTVYGGTYTSEGDQAVTTHNAYGGTSILSSSGTVTTCTMDGGTVDLQKSLKSRTISTFNRYQGTVRRADDVVTITTEVHATRLVTETVKE